MRRIGERLFVVVCVLMVACVLTVNAKTLTEDMVVKQVDINDYIAVTSKVTGVNIINAEAMKFPVSTMIPKGSNTDRLIVVLQELLGLHSFVLVKTDYGYVVKRSSTLAKVLYTSGDVKRMGDILKYRAFLTKSNYDRDVFVNGDGDSQSLTVVGNARDLVAMEKVFTGAEIRNRKVILEAKIAELSSTDIQRIGMKYGVVTAGGDSSDVLRKLSSRKLEDGMVKSAFAIGAGDGASALSATLNFLASTGSVYILEEPSIEVNSGQESELYSGNTIYVQDRVDKNGVAGYTKTDVGLRLTVKPYIGNNGKVNLEITILAENKVGMDENGKPIITKKKLHTTTTVMDKKSVILGSLSKNGKSAVSSGIPWLKDIPIVGWMFGSSTEEGTNKTMLIILKAYIVKDGEERQVREAIEKDKRYQALYSSELYKEFVGGNNKDKDKKVDTDVGKSTKEEERRLHDERIKKLFGI